MYLARRGSAAIAVIGSSNLTGGLVNNIEAAVLLRGRPDDLPVRAAWDQLPGISFDVFIV